MSKREEQIIRAITYHLLHINRLIIEEEADEGEEDEEGEPQGFWRLDLILIDGS